MTTRGSSVAARRGAGPIEACGPDALARYFRVLGDPTRLSIIEALLEKERTVSELVELVSAPQSRVSNHLACLKWCRFAEAQRRGRHVVYRISDPRVRELLATARILAAENGEHLASCRRIGPDWI
jgi:DNA-binding transcriptional ArsR family regulator